MKLRMRVKKALCTVAALAMASGAAFAASPSQVYEEAARNMMAEPTGEYVLQVNMEMPFLGNVSLTNTIDMQAEPFQMKSEAVAKVLNNTKTVHSYVEQDGDVLHIYYEDSKDDNAWKKATRKLKSADPISKRFHGDHNVLAGVKSVTAAGKNSYDVVYDASRLYREGDKEKWAADGYKKEQAEGFAKVLQALQKTGDVTVNVTVDPKTKRISKVTMPLTPQMRAVAQEVLAESDASDANKAVMEQFIKYSEISMTIDCAPLPKDADLTAPKEVKEAAVPGTIPGSDDAEEADKDGAAAKAA